MTTQKEYVKVEGWSNYATWNVSLWIDNEIALYNLKVGILKQSTSPVITANHVATFVQVNMHNTTPDLNNDYGYRIEDVNW